MSRIALKRAAAQKREEAHSKLETLKSRITAGGLTPTEIARERQGVEALLSEAKEIDGLGSLEGLMNRPADASPGAREILANGDGGRTVRQSAFPTIGKFLRTVRGAGDGYDPDEIPDQDQVKELRQLRARGARLASGEELMPTKDLGDAELKALVGDDSGSAGRGDYLVPTEHMKTLLRAMAESQQFANRARRVPMTRRTADFPRLKQTDATDTRPFFSFAAVTKLAEGAQIAEREPTFEQLTLTAIKYAAYLEASDELLADSIVDMPPVLVDLLSSALAYEFDRDTIRGTGTGEPLGFLGSAAEYAVNRETADSISLADIFEMESRFFGTEGVYLYHPSIIPKLYALQANGIIVWNGDVSSAVPGTLLGRPLVRTHKLPALGTKGDLCLVDPSFYLVGDLQAISVQSSIHYKFRSSLTAWRAVFRGAGTPWPAGTFSAESDGTNKTFEISPFIVLDVPAGT